jgi:hypothetical protein
MIALRYEQAIAERLITYSGERARQDLLPGRGPISGTRRLPRFDDPSSPERPATA